MINILNKGENLVKRIKVIRTSKNSFDKLAEKEDILFTKEEKNVEFNVVNIYDDVEFQEIVGFGGAITQSTCLNLNTLDNEKRNELLERYFSPTKGIRLYFM